LAVDILKFKEHLFRLSRKKRMDCLKTLLKLFLLLALCMLVHRHCPDLLVLAGLVLVLLELLGPGQPGRLPLEPRVLPLPLVVPLLPLR
jgi:hypothetical protein